MRNFRCIISAWTRTYIIYIYIGDFQICILVPLRVTRVLSFFSQILKYLKNQLIYIDHTILACVIFPGFTIDKKDLWLMLYTKYIFNRRSFKWQNNAGRLIVFGESSTSGETLRVSFGSDEDCLHISAASGRKS